MTAPAPTPTIRKLGPGVLTIGGVGAVLDFSGVCTKAQITWKVNTTDDVTVLDGSTIAGERDYTATLEVTAYQDDLTVGGLIDYSWAHKGTQVPFTFQPYADSREVTGQLVIDPLDIGGDVKKKNTSDIKWGCVGEPSLIDNLG